MTERQSSAVCKLSVVRFVFVPVVKHINSCERHCMLILLFACSCFSLCSRVPTLAFLDLPNPCSRCSLAAAAIAAATSLYVVVLVLRRRRASERAISWSESRRRERASESRRRRAGAFNKGSAAAAAFCGKKVSRRRRRCHVNAFLRLAE